MPTMMGGQQDSEQLRVEKQTYHWNQAVPSGTVRTPCSGQLPTASDAIRSYSGILEESNARISSKYTGSQIYEVSGCCAIVVPREASKQIS